MSDQILFSSPVFRFRTLGLIASSWMMIGCGDSMEIESQWAAENAENAMEVEGNSLAEDAAEIPVINTDDLKWEGEAQAPSDQDRAYAAAGWEKKREVKLPPGDRNFFKQQKKEMDRQQAPQPAVQAARRRPHRGSGRQHRRRQGRQGHHFLSVPGNPGPPRHRGGPEPRRQGL